MRKNPLVSIIIPVYNGANYLKEAIDSALNQTYKGIEVIVVNDGSTDNGKTKKIAESYGDKIKYYEKENGGVSSALNYGIKKMSGEYFSWLSHDDVYKSEKIEKQMQLINESDNSKIIVLCELELIDKNFNLIDKKIKKRKFSDGTLTSYDLVLDSLLKDGTFNGCALLIPKNVFKEVGTFNENLRFCQDGLLWLKIFLNHYNLIYTNESFVYSRVHEQQVTQTKRELFFKDMYEVAKELKDLMIKNSTKKRNYYYLFAKRNALYSINKAVKLYIKENKKNKLLTCIEIIKLYFYLIIGKFRPIIRKMYYKFKLQIKTN